MLVTNLFKLLSRPLATVEVIGSRWKPTHGPTGYKYFRDNTAIHE